MIYFHHIIANDLQDLDDKINNFIQKTLVTKIINIQYEPMMKQSLTGVPVITWAVLIVYECQTHMQGTEVEQ